jgi:hypothetical protein
MEEISMKQIIVEDMYWKKENLLDEVWRLERQIRTLTKHRKNIKAFVARHYNLLLKVRQLETQIAMYEQPLFHNFCS